jgi:CBS domain-containing protein
MVNRELSVSDVMTRSPVTISPDATLIDCSRVLVKKKVGSVILVKDKKMRGMLTTKDIVWAITKKKGGELVHVKASDIATKKVKFVKPTLAMSKALKIMKRTGFKRLPVVHKGNLVGMITIKDILKVEPTLYSNVSDLVKIRDEEEKLKRREMLADRPESLRQGLCEECGNYDWLYKVDGRVMCESCMDEM